MSSVEVIDLENPSNICSMIEDYPVENGGMTLGLIDGLLKSCGSGYDIEDCYDYDPDTNSWTSSASLVYARARPRSSFIDGIWLVSGDDALDAGDAPMTTEMWTGSTFVEGPRLPTPMYDHCQFTINSTHVFFAEAYETGRSFLLDWFAQTWTEVPPMNVDRNYPSCGLINNPENGLEAVIVQSGVSEIFNFRDESWRTGPPVEPFIDAGFTQIGDTFVVVGGLDEVYGDEEFDTIYKFDHIKYEWILMSQRLQVSRYAYPGVVSVPDEFVTCS